MIRQSLGKKLKDEALVADGVIACRGGATEGEPNEIYNALTPQCRGLIVYLKRLSGAFISLYPMG